MDHDTLSRWIILLIIGASLFVWWLWDVDATELSSGLILLVYGAECRKEHKVLSVLCLVFALISFGLGLRELFG